MQGYLEKGIQTPMAQGRSTKTISMIKWIRTSRLSRKNALSPNPELPGWARSPIPKDWSTSNPSCEHRVQDEPSSFGPRGQLYLG